MTPQQLKNKIADLKQWLQDNHPEHEARPHNEAQLQNAKDKLKALSTRPIERDTFDIREHNFYNV